MEQFKKPKTQVAVTNDCSIHSKSSIVFKGFVEDPFLYYFVPKPTKRSPIINRGYYVRHRAIEYGFRKIFEENPGNKNVIITLGCGFDTSSFRYPDNFFIEIDYPSVCHRKAKIIEEESLIKPEDIYCSAVKPRFDDNFGQESSLDCQNFEVILSSRRYILIGGDLRNTTKLEEFLLSFNNNGRSLFVKYIEQFWPNQSNSVNKNCDLNITLFNECSLCYIEQSIADRMLQILIEHFSKLFMDSSDRKLTSINYLGYEMFNSSKHFQHNNFGQFMIDHFESVGASILTFLDEDEIEARFRSQKLGFEQIELINMKEFLRKTLLDGDLEERKRIDLIEPFDEWEELDNVCASYLLTLARMQVLPRLLQKPTNILSKIKMAEFSSKSTTNHNQSKNIEPNISYKCLPIFGHCSVFDSGTTTNSIKIFGGFGLEPSTSIEFINDEPIDDNRTAPPPRGHQRYSNIVELVLDERDNRLSQIRPIVGKVPLNRVHSRVVQLQSSSNENTSRYFLSGGRTSPAKIQSNLIVEIIEDNQQKQNHRFEVIEAGESINSIPNSYRHVCCEFGNDRLIQFGGIQSNIVESKNNTVYVLDLGTMRWSSNQISGLITDRHSLGFCRFQSNSILLNGGLSVGSNQFIEELDPNQFELIDYRQSSTVHKYRINNFGHNNNRLYSHSLRSISDFEVLVIGGGIGQHSIQNTIYRIDFRSLNVLEQFELKNSNDKTSLMLHNFSAEVIPGTTSKTKQQQQLYLIGGGGNCFSFGTHFNPISLYELI